MEHIEKRFEAMVNAIEALNKVIESCSTRVAALETTVNDQIIGTLKRRLDEEQFEEFSACHGAKLEPITADLKVINGEDYDPMKTLWEDVKEHKDEEGFDEGGFVDATVSEITEKLAKLKGVAEVAAETASEEEKEVIEAAVEQAEAAVEAEATGEITSEQAEEIVEAAEETVEEIAESDNELAEYEEEFKKGGHVGGRQFWKDC
jgi:FAD/FMN-containing dehydrogenase